MKGQENAVNTFKDGLLMDTNPLSNDGTSLTNALNATLTTHNGNELMLQNDMGNGRINKVRLDEGYIPVGIKEHGGIIYIASYNPETKKGQIGSFPYPKVEYDNSDFKDDDEGYNTPLDYIYGNGDPQDSKSVCTDAIIYFNEIIHNSQKVKLFTTTNEDGEQVQVKFKQGDSFSLIFDPETSEYLKADNIVASIISKTASEYITLHTISKEELEKESPISITYDRPYSGTLFLQISLNIPNTFDINYEYNNDHFIVYPNAYNSEDPENIHTSAVDAVLKDGDQHITNFDCGSSITLNPGTYDMCPVTSDKGYLKYLEQKVILDANSKNNIFKYTFNDGELDLYWDILDKNSHYSEDITYRFTYNFYPLENAGSVTSLQALQQLPYTTQVSKEGYPVISGLRNLKCTLPQDSIYVLLITVASKSQDIYSDEQPCFGGFIYCTPRYNDKCEEVDNFNNDINNEETQEVPYTFNRQLLELNRTSIINRHLIQDEWQETQGVVLFSDTQIPSSNIPIAYSSEIAVEITKAEEPVVVAPKQNVNFIYDSDQFSIESSKFDIDLSNATVKDIPEKNKSTRIITSYENNTYGQAIQKQDSITFYRYISSESSDEQAQQTRTFKQLMPIFNPNMLDYEELFGFDFNDILPPDPELQSDHGSVTGVFGALNYLNMTEHISLSVANSDDPDYIGLENRILSSSEGNSSPNVIKQFLLTHSKDNRGQDISSIFDLFGGAQGNKETYGEMDKASLRIESITYMPKRPYSGLDDEDCRWDEFAKHTKFIIPSCITYTNQPLLLPLPSSTIGIYYTSGYKKQEDGKYESRSEYPVNIITPAHNLSNRTQDLLIPAYKKLFCLLSQVFTLQQQESYIYVVGPSEVTVNYNIQDDSYVEYSTTLQNDNTIFIDTTIQGNLNSVEAYLSESNLTVTPHNYIGRLKLQDEQDNYFFYGRNVDMNSSLYNNILNQYINAYDESIVIDNSSGYSENDIYYLDSKKLWERYKDVVDTPEVFINYFEYRDAHNRIETKENYPMDNNGELVTDGDYNKIWSDYSIYYNPAYNCYQYDLSKADFLSLLTKSTINSDHTSNIYFEDVDYMNSGNHLFDWAGNCWRMAPLINNFMTIEEAKSTSGSQIDSYSNNFIVLRVLNPVSSQWIKENKPGPLFAKIDLGFRGNNHSYVCPVDPTDNINSGDIVDVTTLKSTKFFTAITEKIQNIINLYNHNYIAITGRYSDQATPTTPTH